MCRHVGWLGAPRTLSSLLLEPAWGLQVQSYAPRRQQHGVLNADGWGVGFYADDAPRRWRSARPLWADASFASLAPVLKSHSVVAAVRSATVGMPVEESAAAPFTDGGWLLSHNGIVNREILPPSWVAESVVDSAVLAAHVFNEGPHRLGELVAKIGAADPKARLNVLVASTDRILATTWGDTLSILHAADGVVVASEPYDDDPAWMDIPDRHLVRVTNGKVDVTPL